MSQDTAAYTAPAGKAWRRVFLVLLRERIVGIIEPKSDGSFDYQFLSGLHESAVSAKLESIRWGAPALGLDSLSEAGIRFHGLQVPHHLDLRSLLDLAVQVDEARLPHNHRPAIET
ncbi:MAG TPA: hypothetical protein VD969_11690 [Symbiobacteriaceae bacterium]|nr:hypothetical protein [Symbiobacteriaceae bacterium]